MDLFSIGKMLQKHKSYKKQQVTIVSIVMLFILSANLFAQTRSAKTVSTPIIMKGIVNDKQGPLIGVNIKIKGTGKGTTRKS